jgi:subtilisin family serine protease
MSTIGAWDPGNLIGAAPYASFILAKTEDDRGETPVEEDNWVAGVEWAEWLGTDIITSSLSYLDWYSPAEFDGITAYASQAANRIYEMGVVICTSVGNEGPRPLTLGTPADAEGVLAIGAVDSTWSLVDFSSRGPTADGRIKPNVLAMGRHVTVARPYTYDEFSLGNGTSFSCPLAAGALALLIQAHPDWPSYEIYDAVENTATHAIYPDNAWGYGIVRLERALDYPSISGYIADAQNQKPVPSAYLFFASKDTSGTVTVDSAGFYLVGNLPYGQYRIIARAPGYLDGEAVTTSLPPDEVCDFKIRKR